MVDGLVESPFAIVSYIIEFSIQFSNHNFFILIHLIAIDCGEPPTYEFTISNYTATFFKSVVQYSCINDNYYLTEHKLPDNSALLDPSSVVQTSRIECMSNGRWATKPIKCNRKLCKKKLKSS